MFKDVVRHLFLLVITTAVDDQVEFSVPILSFKFCRLDAGQYI